VVEAAVGLPQLVEEVVEEVAVAAVGLPQLVVAVAAVAVGLPQLVVEEEGSHPSGLA
jgi:hypothetical protein